MTFGAGTFGSFAPQLMQRPPSSGLAAQMRGGQMGAMPRPNIPSGLAAMFGAQQQPMGFGAPQPQLTNEGRIPVGGGTSPDLSKLFGEADKMASSSGGMFGFTPDQKTKDAYADMKRYNTLYKGYPGPTASVIERLPYEIASHGVTGLSGVGTDPKDIKAMQRQMDMMVMSGMSYGEVLDKMGGTSKSSAGSLAAQKDAEAFLKGLGL